MLLRTTTPGPIRYTYVAGSFFGGVHLRRNKNVDPVLLAHAMCWCEVSLKAKGLFLEEVTKKRDSSGRDRRRYSMRPELLLTEQAIS